MIKKLHRLFILFILFFVAGGDSLFAVPLNGNYTINSALATGGTNFQSFTAFADSINLNGISGNVITIVAAGSGPYNEQVVFDSIAGTGPNATIVLDGNGETLTALTDSANRHVLRLSTIQYFTVASLNVVRDTASTSGFYGIHIYGTGNHITIQNCSVDMSGSSSTLIGGFIASGSETSILTTGNFHNITFTNDTSTGGGYGISVFGLISNLASNIVISENVIYDFHSNGVYLRETNGAIVRRNHFDKRTSNVTSVNAIQVAQAANINTSIYDNFIKVSQQSNGTMNFRGIYLFNGTGHKVYNNVIYDVNLTSGNFTAIEVRTDSTAPEISFNTISLENQAGSTGDLFGIKEELSNTGSILRNNMISITQNTSGIAAAIVLGSNSSLTNAINSNFNNLWVPNAYVGMKNSLTPVVYPSIVNWRAVTNQDMNGISKDPIFISSVLTIPTNVAADNAGAMISYIPNDVLGYVRSNPPDIGAYEFLQVGISKLTSNSFVIYPNPATSLITADPAGINSGRMELVIYNSMGQKVFSENVLINKGEKIKIDVTYFIMGIYFLEMASNNNRFCSRFVKE